MATKHIFSASTTDTSTIIVTLTKPFDGNLVDLADPANAMRVEGKRRTRTKANTQLLIPMGFTVASNPVHLVARCEEYVTRTGQRRSNFSNTVALAFRWGGRERNIRYFRTGKITLNGCKSATEAHELVEAFIDGVLEGFGGEPVRPAVASTNYVMINDSFWVQDLPNGKLDLSDMDAWCKERGTPAFYDPDISPPLKLNVGVAKVTIYASGNVQVKAMKSFDDSGEARRRAISVIDGYLGGSGQF